MDKKKVKMIVPDLSTLDMVASVRQEHPEWDSRQIGHYLESECKISLSAKDLDFVFEECMALAPKSRYATSAIVALSRDTNSSRNKISMPYWGWFSW